MILYLAILVYLLDWSKFSDTAQAVRLSQREILLTLASKYPTFSTVEFKLKLSSFLSAVDMETRMQPFPDFEIRDFSEMDVKAIF